MWLYSLFGCLVLRIMWSPVSLNRCCTCVYSFRLFVFECSQDADEHSMHTNTRPVSLLYFHCCCAVSVLGLLLTFVYIASTRSYKYRLCWFTVLTSTLVVVVSYSKWAFTISTSFFLEVMFDHCMIFSPQFPKLYCVVPSVMTGVLGCVVVGNVVGCELSSVTNIFSSSQCVLFVLNSFYSHLLNLHLPHISSDSHYRKGTRIGFQPLLL